jgi:D-3-phosphoglycerate dehydrogenase
MENPIENQKIKVLITDRFALNALVRLQTDSRLQVTHDPKWYQRELSELGHFEILIIRSLTKIDKNTLGKFPKLKLIISCTVGFDHINIEDCSEKQIIVSHCPSAHTASAAELTWALVLACARRIREAHSAVLNADWDRQKIIGTELAGKTYGVIGLGRIGQKVAQIAKAFDMNLIAHDPYQNDEAFEKFQIPRSSLEEVLTQADVLSLHVPLTRETKHMLGEDFLKSMQPHSILVNTSRGPVIHEKALVKALQNQKMAAVGLDVFEYEPLSKSSALFQFSQVVLSPHVGATTREAFEKASFEAHQKLLDYIANKKINDLLPLDTAWFKEALALHKST